MKKPHKALYLLAMLFLCGHVYAQTKTEVQSTPTSSSFPSLSDRNAIKVTFCCDSDGTPTPINWVWTQLGTTRATSCEV